MTSEETEWYHTVQGTGWHGVARGCTRALFLILAEAMAHSVEKRLKSRTFSIGNFSTDVHENELK